MPLESLQVDRSATKEVLREIEVDLWKTKMHGKIIGIKQKEQHMAKSRYFTRDMELIGEAKENGETIGHIGKRDLNDRLVIRLFSKSMYYQASLEEMISREMVKKIIHKQRFPCFKILVKDYPYITKIEKERGGPANPEIYCYIYFHEDTKTFEPFIIRSTRGPGEDFDIKTFNKKIAEIDGKRMNIGGSFIIRIFDQQLANLTSFVRTLIVFSATLKYLNEVNDRIDTFDDFRKKKELIKLFDEELMLELNPRKYGKIT
ncbi:MAG: hypothetical protein ACFFD4_06210 [Candidatus Odinarchaeota archaeon]